jgi:hypothetical protein
MWNEDSIDNSSSRVAQIIEVASISLPPPSPTQFIPSLSEEEASTFNPFITIHTPFDNETSFYSSDTTPILLNQSLSEEEASTINPLSTIHTPFDNETSFHSSTATPILLNYIESILTTKAPTKLTIKLSEDGNINPQPINQSSSLGMTDTSQTLISILPTPTLFPNPST